MRTTDEEQIILERIGAALRVRRRLRSLKSPEAAEAAGLSLTNWRRIERGWHGARLASVLRALKTVGVSLRMLTDLIERAILRGLDEAAVTKIMMNPERAGRPRKETNV